MRTPHALHKVFGPSGLRLQRGVSVQEQLAQIRWMSAMFLVSSTKKQNALMLEVYSDTRIGQENTRSVSNKGGEEEEDDETVADAVGWIAQEVPVDVAWKRTARKRKCGSGKRVLCVTRDESAVFVVEGKKI